MTEPPLPAGAGGMPPRAPSKCEERDPRRRGQRRDRSHLHEEDEMEGPQANLEPAGEEDEMRSWILDLDDAEEA